MTNAERLDQVLSLFVERFHLGPQDESRGADAIRAAIAAGDSADIAGLRVLLLEKYTLYPQFEPRIRALLDACESSAVGEVEADETGTDEAEVSESVLPVAEEDTSATIESDEPDASGEPEESEERPRRRRR